MSFALRPGTLDEYIYQQVLEGNEYGLPDELSEHDIVVDVGAHIGTFARAALNRGAGKVYCIEPDPDNLALARINLGRFIDAGRVTLIQGAAWRADSNDDTLRFQRGSVMAGLVNTGGGRVVDDAEGYPVTKIDFDALLSEVTANGRKEVRFLKLDCEGAEWPILFTSRHLAWIREIAGEIHEARVMKTEEPSVNPNFQDLPLDALVSLLEQQGFNVQYCACWLDVPHFERLGMLTAKRATQGD